MTKETAARILVVDDEKDMLETCQKMLRYRSFEVDVSQEPARALELCREREYDLVIVDLKMPAMDGMSLMQRIHEFKQDQLVVLITAYGSVENALKAVQSGAFDFIRKPFKMEEFLVVVGRALRFKALQDENERLQEKLHASFQSEQIIGKSPLLQKALVQLRQVSEVDVPAVITGESGTGKELFARAIHANSARKKGPFLVVDCAALPEMLLESELFGYERGAFTGAVRSKAGLFEAASGGTILLDEIAEMPLNLQAKLLRALEQGVTRRLGSNQELKVDARLLAATNRNLEKMVAEGEFREDLYYRIHVVEIRVPPLREREGDVPLLVDYFFRGFRPKVARSLEGFSRAAMLILEQYDWPGNVRELRHAVERACTFCESTQILPQDLPPAILSAVQEEKGHAGGSHFQSARRELIEDFERKYLIEMLTRTGGNVTEAARFSGMSRPAFYRLINKYSLVPSEFK